MATTFPLFPLLPPELRLRIWHIALTTPWTCTTRALLRPNQEKTIGTHPTNPISHACPEARHLQTQSFTQIDHLGWFHFPKHLLFIRDLTVRGVNRARRVKTNYSLTHNLQHVVLNVCSQQKLYASLEYMGKAYTSLKSIVVVGPWFLPEDTEAYDSVRDWIAPYEDWGEVFARSPTELDLAVLVDAIERGERGGEARLGHGLSVGEYKARLDKAVRRLPEPLPDGLRLVDNVYWRTRRMLAKVEAMIQGFDELPRLYLQTVEQLRGPKGVGNVRKRKSSNR